MDFMVKHYMTVCLVHGDSFLEENGLFVYTNDLRTKCGVFAFYYLLISKPFANITLFITTLDKWTIGIVLEK